MTAAAHGATNLHPHRSAPLDYERVARLIGRQDDQMIAAIAATVVNAQVLVI